MNRLMKPLTLALTWSLVQVMIGATPVFASGTNERKAQTVEQVKTAVFKLGVGKTARAEVKLKDKTKLSGYISEVSDDQFVLTDGKTGKSTAIKYADVTEVKKKSGRKGMIAALAILGIGVVVFVVTLGQL